MTTSNAMSLSSVVSLEDKPIPAFEIGYVKATAQDEAYESFLLAFLKERSRDPAVTKAFIARRVGKSPEQITRYLGSPGNWTLATYAILCAAIGYKPVFGVEKIAEMRQGNACHPLAISCSVTDNCAVPAATISTSAQPLNPLDQPAVIKGDAATYASGYAAGGPNIYPGGNAVPRIMLGPNNRIDQLYDKMSPLNGFLLEPAT